MQQLILSLFIIFPSVALADQRAWDYFRTVPESQAHLQWGEALRPTLEPYAIRALIWNIKKAEEKTWQQDFLNLGKGKDLLVLQEGYDNSHFLSTTASFMGLRWDMGKSFTYMLYDNHATGTVVGSKVGPTELKVRHTKDLEPVTQTPKTLIFAKYPIAQRNDDLLVINVHAVNFTGQKEFENNMNQIREEILAHEGPILVAGDFNTRTRERTQFMNTMMKRLRFTEVKWKNGDKRMKAYLTPYYLDHAFVRGLAVKEATVYGDSKGSDHKPMTLTLRVL